MEDLGLLVWLAFCSCRRANLDEGTRFRLANDESILRW